MPNQKGGEPPQMVHFCIWTKNVEIKRNCHMYHYSSKELRIRVQHLCTCMNTMEVCCSHIQGVLDKTLPPQEAASVLVSRSACVGHFRRGLQPKDLHVPFNNLQFQ